MATAPVAVPNEIEVLRHQSGQRRGWCGLLAAFDKASQRMDAGLASLESKKLSEPAPYSPTNNPKETAWRIRKGRCVVTECRDALCVMNAIQKRRKE